jgi:hypothetical protein
MRMLASGATVVARIWTARRQHSRYIVPQVSWVRAPNKKFARHNGHPEYLRGST